MIWATSSAQIVSVGAHWSVIFTMSGQNGEAHMDDSWTNVVQAIASVTSIAIATATIVIARRQTEIAEQQKELGERQATTAEAQKETNDLLAAAQLDISPITVPARIRSAENGISFSLVNLGKPAVDVWIEAIAVVDHLQALVLITCAQRVDILRESELVSLKGNFDLPNPEKVVALLGNCQDSRGNSHPIEYETAPGLLNRLRGLSK